MDNESGWNTSRNNHCPAMAGARVTAALYEAAKNRKFKDLRRAYGTQAVRKLTGL